MVEVKEKKVSVIEVLQEVASKPVGVAGLLMWLTAIVSAIDKSWGILLAFGFGLWFVVKAKKELKEAKK